MPLEAPRVLRNNEWAIMAKSPYSIQLDPSVIARSGRLPIPTT